MKNSERRISYVDRIANQSQSGFDSACITASSVLPEDHTSGQNDIKNETVTDRLGLDEQTRITEVTGGLDIM
jgi:hypothetical protein